MKLKNPPKFTGRDIGLILDQSHGDADTLNRRTIALAIEHGFESDILDDTNALGSDSQELSEEGDAAVEFLNELELPAYCWFYFEDNCLFLFPNIDNVKEELADNDRFISSRRQDYPPADYRGEWLHISDHGNATLYVRNGRGQDKEIWGIV